MSAIGYAVLPMTVSMKGIGQTLSREFNGPAEAAGRKAAADMSKSLVDGAKAAAGEVAKARKGEEDAAKAVEKAEKALAEQRAKAEQDARKIESAENKLTAAREKGTQDVTKAEQALADARDVGTVEEIERAESRLVEVRSRTDATIIDREVALDRARGTAAASADKASDAEEGVAQAKDKAAEAAENVIAATRRYDDAIDGTTDSIVDMSSELRDLQGDFNRAGDEATTFGDRLKSGLMEIGRGALLGIGAKIGTSIMSGVQGAISDGWRTALDLDSAERALSGLTGDAGVAKDTIAELREVSRQSPIDTTSYLEASQSLAYTGVEAERIAPLLESVGKIAIGTGNDGGRAFDSMNNALGSIVNQGKASRNELNQISKAGIPIFDMLNDHLGITTEELNKLISTGAIGLDEVVGSLEAAGGVYAGDALESYEEMQDTLENQWIRFKDEINTELGAALGPLLSDIDWGEISAAASELAGSFIELIPPLIEFATWMADNSSWLIPLAGIIGGIVLAVKTWSIAQGILNVVLAANPIGLVVIAVAGLVAGIVYLATQTEFFQNLWEGFMEILHAAWDWLKNVFSGIWDAIVDAWNSAFEWVSDKLDMVGDAFSTMGDFASDALDWVTGKLDDMVAFIGDLPGKIKGFFSDAGSWLVDSGKNIIQGLLDGAGALLSRIGEFFLDKVPGFIKEPFKRALGIESPSTVFADYGDDTVEGFLGGVESRMPDVDTAMGGLGDRVAGAGAGIASAATYAASPLPTVGAVGEPVGEATVTAGVDIEGLDAGDAFVEMGDQVAATASDVLDPVWDHQGEAVGEFGAHVHDTVLGGVAPDWAMMGDSLTATADTVVHPMLEGVNAGLEHTGLVATHETGNVITPSWQTMGLNVEAVKTGTIDPAFAGIQDGLHATAGVFASGTSAMISEWDRLREGVAAPVRFAVNTVFNDGLVGMWNSVAEMVGLDKMSGHRINFWAGGVLPGYTPGRDPFTFVEPNTGMSIGLSGGEAIMRPEWAQAVGPAGVAAMNKVARSEGASGVHRMLEHGGRTSAFAQGGIWGSAHIGDFSQGAILDSMTAFVNRFFPALQLTSGWRFTDNGYHSRGMAGDFSNQVRFGPPTPESIGLANAIYRNFKGQTAELIHWPLSGWNNVVNGADYMYDSNTNAGHTDHVHWALPRPLMAEGVKLDFSGGAPIVVDPREIVESMIGDDMKRTKEAAHGYSGSGGAIDGLPAGFYDAMIEPMIETLVEAFEAFGGDPGGADVGRWRPLAMQALSRHGYDASQHIAAMMEQIMIESGGNPAAVNNWDINAINGVPSGGLLQVIEPTYRRVRNAYPEAFAGLPDDRMHPLTNLTAGVGAVRMDWGGPAGRWPTTGGYDSGGWLPPTPGGFGTYYNHTGAPEPVFTADQWALLRDQLGLNIDLVEELRRFVLVVNRDDDDRDELAAQAVYDVFGREPLGDDLHKVLHAGPRAWQETAAHLEHIAATGDYLENEWFSDSSQLAEAARAVFRGRVGFDEWASASEEQDRMGTPEEFAQHYGQQVGAEFLDGALGMVGLDGLIGGQWRQSIRDFAEVGGWELPAFGPAPILDDEGRVPGTRLESMEEATVEASELGDEEVATAAAEKKEARQPITIIGDNIPADQVEELLERVEGVEFDITRMKGERASVTTTKVLA